MSQTPLLNLSDIQHFSLGDGDGIRTTVFFKGCNLHCPWCHNPETWSSLPETLVFSNGIIKHCGKLWTIEEVMKEVLSDAPFYQESGGGVTLSGGEVMLQIAGAAALAKALKDAGISVIVDTAGMVPYSSFQTINPYVDEYFFDLKAGTEEGYRQTIGGELSLVTQNMHQLLLDGKKVRARIPLIPDFNCDESSLRSMIKILQSVGIQQVDLLPFHRLGVSKYRALNRPYAYEKMPGMTRDQAEPVAAFFRPYFKVRIEM